MTRTGLAVIAGLWMTAFAAPAAAGVTACRLVAPPGGQVALRARPAVTAPVLAWIDRRHDVILVDVPDRRPHPPAWVEVERVVERRSPLRVHAGGGFVERRALTSCDA